MSKYEECIVSHQVKADDISLFPQRLAPKRITYGNGRNGEEKSLPIDLRLVKSEGRPNQLAIELGGDYHVEDLFCYTTDITDWKHYGKIWLSKSQAISLAMFILNNKTKFD